MKSLDKIRTMKKTTENVLNKDQEQDKDKILKPTEITLIIEALQKYIASSNRLAKISTAPKIKEYYTTEINAAEALSFKLKNTLNPELPL